MINSFLYWVTSSSSSLVKAILLKVSLVVLILFKMKDTTLDFIKKLTGQSGNSFTIRETGKFLSNFINELKIQYEIKE